MLHCPVEEVNLTCEHPNCRCYKPVKEIEALEPPIEVKATHTLADYIKRIQQASEPVPEPVTVDANVLRHAIRALERSNPYISGVIRKELDKAKNS